MEMSVIIILAAVFVCVAVVSSAAYYFARYYVKTDSDDKELLTKKPIDWEESIGVKRTEVQETILSSSAGSALPVNPASSGPSTTPLSLPLSPQKTLSEALSKSQAGFWGRLKGLAFGSKDIEGSLRDELEEILYTSDLGPATAELLLERVAETLSSSERKDSDSVRQALREEMLGVFRAVPFDQHNPFQRLTGFQKPVVWMVVGVNGAGKTTTIGKLASQANDLGLKTLIVAGDTFRAAADSQLRAWAERAGCEIFSPEAVKDPSAVAFSGLEKAKASAAELMIVDTAGRLHTQDHLMEELKKMKRVLTKTGPGVPQEVFLVIDANAGQNALQQAREFHAAVGLTGVIVTKLDGSSKAGVALGVAHELKIPIVYIGVGESVEDLRPFDAKAFVEAIL